MRKDILADVGEGKFETFGGVEATDSGFDRGGISEGAEEIVGSEANEGLAVDFPGLGKDPLAHEEGQNGVTDPRFGPLLGDFFLGPLHGVSSGLEGLTTGTLNSSGGAGGRSFWRSSVSLSRSQ